MDFEALIPIIIVLLVFLFGGTRRKQKPEQQTSEQGSQANLPPESEEVFPPFMENFENTTDEMLEMGDDSAIPEVAQESEPETVPEPTPEREPIEPPPIPVDSPTPLPTKPIPATSLIELTPETFRQGIILAEILGRPKTFRSRPRRW